MWATLVLSKAAAVTHHVPRAAWKSRGWEGGTLGCPPTPEPTMQIYARCHTFSRPNAVPAGGGPGLPVAFRLSLAFCVGTFVGNSHFLFRVVASLQLSRYL